MRKLIALAVAAALLTTGTPALSKDDGPKAPGFLTERDRTTDGGRAVEIILIQDDIDTSIDVGRVAIGPNDSYWWGWTPYRDRKNKLMMAARDKAEVNALPVRKALAGFEVNDLAVKATKVALAKPGWFQPQSYMSNRDPAYQGPAAFTATTSTPQIARITYRYELSPDFSQIRVFADIIIERRSAVTVGKVVMPAGAIYRQRIMSIALLRKRGFDERENARLWTAKYGKLAKEGLTAAFAQMETLIPYALNLSEADLAGFEVKGREKAQGGGYFGPLISRNPNDPDNILIWNKGVINVLPIS